jgi:hypothetical protein
MKGGSKVEISYSEMSDLMKCRRLWWFKHYLRLDAGGFTESPLVIGTIVHNVLAEYYKAQSIEDALDVYEMQKFQMSKDDQELYQNLLMQYFEWDLRLKTEESPFMFSTIPAASNDSIDYHGIEEEVIWKDSETGVAFTGRFDMVFRRNGTWTIVDHKTTSSFWDGQIAGLDWQRKVYTVILSQLKATDNITFIHNVITKKELKYPEFNKGGELSKRRCSTVRELAVQALLRNGKDPSEYEEYLSSLPTFNDVFYRIETRPGRGDISIWKAMMRKFAYEITDLWKNELPQPSFVAGQCPRCSFLPICLQGDHIGAVSHIINAYERRK